MSFELSEVEQVELERPRPDRRAITAGSEIVAHRSRESFMRATGGEPKPKTVQLSAAECHRGMLAAWQAKYGVNVQ